MSKDLFNFDSDNNNGGRRKMAKLSTDIKSVTTPIINFGRISKYFPWIIIGLLVIVVGFLIYFRDSSLLDNRYEDENKRLTEEIIISRSKQDSIQKVAEFYMSRDAEWIKKDSINTYQIKQQQIITSELRIEKVIAQQETEKVKKELKEFKKNPPLMDDFIDLIQQTKKRIDLKNENN